MKFLSYLFFISLFLIGRNAMAGRYLVQSGEPAVVDGFEISNDHLVLKQRTKVVGTIPLEVIKKLGVDPFSLGISAAAPNGKTAIACNVDGYTADKDCHGVAVIYDGNL